MSDSTVWQAVLLCAFLYLSLHYVLRSVFALGAALRTLSAQPLGDSEPADVVAASRFSIPVSVLVVADGDEAAATRTIESVLRFRYPTYEVVVVVDDTAGKIPARWQEDYELQPCEVFFRRQLVTQPVRRIYRAGSGARLLVVAKAPGGRGDALNCAVNFSRYRYVCCLTSGVTYSADALIRLMRPIAEAPATNVGAIAAVAGASGPATVVAKGAWARIGRLRRRLAGSADLVTRSTYNVMTTLGLLPTSAVGAAVWRRDVVVEQGGFSGRRFGEYVDLWLRLKRVKDAAGTPRVLLMPDQIGHWHGMTKLGTILRQSAEAQAGLMGALARVLRQRRAAGEPTTRRAVSSYVLYGCLAPALEALALASVILGSATGLVGWVPTLLVIGLGCASSGIAANSGSLLGRREGLSSTRGLLFGPLEYLFWRPALRLGQVFGVGMFLFGTRRGPRPPTDLDVSAAAVRSS